jgi:hypothetical protein
MKTTQTKNPAPAATRNGANSKTTKRSRNYGSRARGVESIVSRGADADGIERSAALLLEHNDMWPTFGRGALLFLGQRGRFWSPEGLCVLPDHETGEPTQNVRHFAKVPGGGVRLWTTAAAVAYQSETTLEAWRQLRAYPVFGFTTPLSPDFYRLLQARAAGGGA